MPRMGSPRTLGRITIVVFGCRDTIGSQRLKNQVAELPIGNDVSTPERNINTLEKL